MALRSTILDEVDFKLRLIAHFMKVYDKCVGTHKPTQDMMVDQTKRTDLEILNLVGSNKNLSVKAGRLRDKYGVKYWIDYCREYKS